MATPADLTPQEIASALAARRELGPDYEDAIASALAEKMAKEINSRVDAELLAQGVHPAKADRPQKPPRRLAGDSSGHSTAVAIASLVAGIPVTAIVAGTSNGNVFAIGTAWLGIALVNIAHSTSRKRG